MSVDISELYIILLIYKEEANWTTSWEKNLSNQALYNNVVKVRSSQTVSFKIHVSAVGDFQCSHQNHWMDSNVFSKFFLSANILDFFYFSIQALYGFTFSLEPNPSRSFQSRPEEEYLQYLERNSIQYKFIVCLIKHCFSIT